MYRINRTIRATRHRPHVLRRDGVVEAPTEVPVRRRYREAIAVGWRPFG